MKAISSIILFVIFINFQVNGQSKQSDKSKVYFEQANVYFDKEDYKTALLYCDSAISFDTENVEAYAYRGVCKFQLKNYDAAIEDFDLALVLNNGYAEVYYYRGLCKKELGADKQACEDWYSAYDLGFRSVIKIIKANCKLQEDEIKDNKKSQ